VRSSSVTTFVRRGAKHAALHAAAPVDVHVGGLRAACCRLWEEDGLPARGSGPPSAPTTTSSCPMFLTATRLAPRPCSTLASIPRPPLSAAMPGRPKPRSFDRRSIPSTFVRRSARLTTTTRPTTSGRNAWRASPWRRAWSRCDFPGASRGFAPLAAPRSRSMGAAGRSMGRARRRAPPRRRHCGDGVQGRERGLERAVQAHPSRRAPSVIVPGQSVGLRGEDQGLEHGRVRRSGAR
jgi:hypothetical protein